MMWHYSARAARQAAAAAIGGRAVRLRPALTVAWLAAAVAAGVSGVSAGAAAAGAGMQATGLRCEYLESPLAVDTDSPRLSWRVESPVRGARQTAYQILVAASAGTLKRDRGDLWDTGRVASDETAQIAYAGKPLRSFHPCWWKVRVWDGAGRVSAWSRTATWSMGLLAPSDWHARWISVRDPREQSESAVYLPAPALRREFTLAKPARRAVLYATAAGLYEALLNGKRVGDELFAPGWTEYEKRLYYRAYDVTRLLRAPGSNSIGFMLGDGWYGLHHGGRGQLGVLAQLRVEYADGSVQEVVTDGSWKATTRGPIRSSDIYNGETYDARREMAGWTAVGFDDRDWQPVTVDFAGLTGSGFADVTDKVRAAVRGNALEITVSNDAFGDPAYQVVKSLRVDYRQGTRRRNRTVPEGQTLRISGTAPITIEKAVYGAEPKGVRVAEAPREAHPGSPVRRTGEIRTVKVTEPKPGMFVYDLGQNFAGWVRLRVRGDAGQKVTLRFAEMLNPDGTIYTTNLRAAKCTDTYTLKGGQDETWEPRFTFHGFRYVEVTGYPGTPPPNAVTGIVLNSDGGLTSRFECSNQMLNRLFQNIVWGQRSNYLEVPTDCPQRDERMGWSGDAQIFIGTGAYNMDVAPFFTGADLMSRMADAIGKPDDAQRYRALFGKVCDAFNQAYVQADGRIKGDTQPTYLMALGFGLLPAEKEAAAKARLLALLEKRDWHLSTGFLGVNLLLPVLDQSGSTDVAWRLMTQETYPSWGYEVKQGATTIWERWDGWRDDKGFQDPGMNSFNHYAYGSCGQWMMARIAGIDTDGPAFKHIVVRPAPGGGVTWCRARYDSIRGPIATSWKAENGRFSLDLTVPPNTTATVHVPAAGGGSVTEGGKPAAEAPGVRFLNMDRGAAVFLVGSGQYRFEAR